MNNIRVRFAPSPTGHMHVGNARIAIITYLYALQKNGQFILRIDDTDTSRNSTEYVKSIECDLSWLGIKWDTQFFQSDRLEKYFDIIETLKKEDAVYECYETQEELELQRKIALSRGKPPIYQKTIHKHEEGRPRYYRFRIAGTISQEVIWNDLVKGQVAINPTHMSDPVIVRADGTLTYLLASVIDDMDMNITDVIRGEDHLSNTAIQIAMMNILGAKSIPNFAHIPLMKTKDEKISKRKGGFEISSLRNKGIFSMAINSFLALTGSSQNILPYLSLSEILENFHIAFYSKSSVIYDINELYKLNHKLLISDNLEKSNMVEVKNEIIQLPSGVSCEKNLFDLVKANCEKLEDIEFWSKILTSTENIDYNRYFTEVIQDKDYAILIAETTLNILETEEGLLPYKEFLEKIIKGDQIQKNKTLYMTLRYLFTSLNYGVAIQDIYHYIENRHGKEELVNRIKNSIHFIKSN